MQEALHISDLPQGALDAASCFHAHHLPHARDILQGGAEALVIVLPPAPRDHDDWRRSVARDLAREAAPRRVNVVAGGDDTATATILTYLGGAPGITGQYLAAHEQGS